MIVMLKIQIKEEMYTMTVKCQRIYDKQIAKGKRVLVDRVWPRGVSKEDAQLDEWLKKVAPTTELRKWFNHDPKLYAAFSEKYAKELRENSEQQEAFEYLKDFVASSKEDVILLYAAKDTQYNHAKVLMKLLKNN